MYKRFLMIGFKQGALGAFFCCCALLGRAQTGFDTGLRARALLDSLKAAPDFSPAAAHWLRVRGVEEPGTWWKIGSPGNFWRVWLERRALKGIRARGQRVCILFMPGWPEAGGQTAESGRRTTLPIDLRDAFRRGRALGRTYGDVVDAWEIGNEPDVGFVPENAENYAAYLKAVYLGIRAGAGGVGKTVDQWNGKTVDQWSGGTVERRAEDGGRTAESGGSVEQGKSGPVERWSSGADGGGRGAEDGRGRADGGGPSTDQPIHRSADLPAARAPLVLMAPLALPPGPYWEALVRNGVLSYTDGFNYHYYGYAEDFSGVYRQFEDAVSENGRPKTDSGVQPKAGGSQPSDFSQPASGVVGTRRLPVFLTEYGYGLLSEPAARTVAGRVRQWRWFHDVYRQIRELRIAGPMAFYVPPYFENGTQEFGLSMRSGGERTAEGGGRRTEGSGAEDGGRTAEDGGAVERGNGGPVERWSGGAEGGGAVEQRTEGGGRRAEGGGAEGGGRRAEDGGAVERGNGGPVERWSGVAEGGGSVEQRTEGGGRTADIGPQTSADRRQRSDVGGRTSDVSDPPSVAARQIAGARFATAGLMFSARDFSAEADEPWMSAIGRRVGENTASPALAWLLAEGAGNSAAPQDWPVAVPPASPIVIDFVGGGGMLAAKQCQGYFLGGGPDGTSVGAGELQLYNFGETTVSGRLDAGPLAHLAEEDAGTISLRPGERRSVPVTLRMMADDLLPRAWSVRFSAAPAAIADSEFACQLYANAGGLVRREWSNLAAVVAGEGNARRLDSRVRAREEPPAKSAGHWRTSEGLTVTESDGRWSFTVTGFPAEPLRPAMAEWVLPDDFQLPEGSLIEFEYRLAERAAAACAAVAEPRAPTMLGAVDRELISVYWRTQNGNLYTVWQTLMATNAWQRYAQMKGSFSMGFYGRANLPWRFADNRPISLVFMFRPNYLPATFEVRSPAIVVYGR
jgi:hypothetical protein